MLDLLRTDRTFRALCAARTISFLGDTLSLVALLLHVADHTGQALAVAMLLLVGDVLPALFGPLAGALADRFDLRRIMISCELAQVLLTIVLALWLPTLPILFALVAARALAAQVFAPASRTAVGRLVAPGSLPSANATLGLGTNGAEAIGPLLAAIGLPLLGVRGVLLVDAATFAVSALLLLRLPPLPADSTTGDPVGLGRATRDGLVYLLRAKVARAVVLGSFVVIACNGIDDVALVFLNRQELHGGDSAVAVLLSAVGIGLLLGYWLLGRRTALVTSMAGLMLTGWAVSSAGNLLTGLSWAVAVAFGLQAVRGLGIAAMDVGATTLLQREVPAELQGRVFGVWGGAIGVAAGLSYVGGALLLDATSARTTFLLAGAGGLAATVLTAVALRPRTSKPDKSRDSP
ncbi:MFS transporter [Pseudonocardia spinosispora]|uniref:MFS transporter n=1 Tax=Pseudonocardia spinosispora TaxID=103441 RepID=UPI000424F03E|nr:MFS transporter [Pseudonocardia spinosispora]